MVPNGCLIEALHDTGNRSTMLHELRTTDVALLAAGVLLLGAVVAGRLSRRSGIPVLVLFLGLGMLAGSEGIGGIAFDDYALSYRIGSAALALILLDGGLRTPMSVVRTALAPAAILATVGVLVTAVAVGVGAHVLGWSWSHGLLLGAIVSPTDAAAVFSVLRSSRVRLNERLAAVVELESGLNDPMAVLLTVGAVSSLADHRPLPVPWLLLGSAEQLAMGAGIGAAVALASKYALRAFRPRLAGLYPVFTISLGLAAYGAASLAHGSGLLAVYIAGVILGNGWLPSRSLLLRTHDFVAWTGQIVMFVALGLLVFPSNLLAVAKTSLSLALLLALVARPLGVVVCLAPFRFQPRELVLVGWLGLRGAVPIILAVIPVLGGVEHAELIFDVVFFVVLVSTLVQGSTVRWVTSALQLGIEVPPTPPALVDIESAYPYAGEIVSFFIRAPSAVCGARLADVPLPEAASVMLIVRAEALVAPRGDTVIHEGDHVFVFCRREDSAFVHLLFGREAD